MMSHFLFSVLSSLSSPSSVVALFLLSSSAFIGHVAGAPKGYDYDIYDDGAYDPFHGPNVVKVNKVVDYYAKPQYAFGYEVDDYYNQLSHGRWEIRDGDVTQGQYRVLLPDGRIQIVSYIADKFGYRPTVEYIGKGAHPPPPPVYANIKPVAVPFVASPAPVLPSALPVVAGTVGPFGLAAPIGAPAVEDYHPVKIKVNSLPINGPFPALDPYAVGYGYGLDPAFAASTNTNKISRKRALLYDRTLFRKDVEKRAALIKNGRVKRKVIRRIKRPIQSKPINSTTST